MTWTTATSAEDRAALELEVACPALGDAGQAALEARARAEIAAGEYGDGGEGRVTVTCGSASATLSWLREGVVVNQRVVALEVDASASVDAILESLHSLLGKPKPIAPSPLVSSSEVEPTRPPVGHRHVGGLAGGDGELWQGAIGAALGVHAGASLRLGGTWSIVALAGPAWGIGSGGGARAWTLRGALRVDDELLPHLVVGVGVGARILWANLDVSGGPSSVVGTTGGVLLTARLSLPLGPVALSAGPQVEAMLRPVVVDVGGSEAFRVPTWVASLAMDAATK